MPIPENFEGLSEGERAALAFRFKQEAQIRVIHYQLLLGLISDPLEYDESAELFELMINRKVTIPRKIDWHEKREQIRALTSSRIITVVDVK